MWLGKGAAMEEFKFSVTQHVVTILKTICYRVGLGIEEIGHVNPLEPASCLKNQEAKLSV